MMNTENEIQAAEINDISPGSNTLVPLTDAGPDSATLPDAYVMPSADSNASSRTNLSTLSRQRASTADLIKAHVALMEKEVILPKHGDLFRLVQHHYYRLQTWHD